MSINIIRRKCLLTLQSHGSGVTPCSHKLFGRSLRCPSSAISTAGRPGPPKEARLTSTASLASDFQQLGEREIRNILTAYNQLLPYSYSHKEAVRYILQKRTDVFAKLFRTNFQHFFVRDRIIESALEEYQTELEKKKLAAERKAAVKENVELTDEKHVESRNAIMLWVRKNTINTFQRHKAVNAMKLGSPLIIDCGFEHLNRGRAIDSYVRQVNCLIDDNLNHGSDPYNVQLFNVSEDSELHVGGAYGPIDDRLVTVSDGCYTEVHNKEDLVMLSPDATLYMEEYDPHKIYIIGGIVDLDDNAPSTRNKAKELGIECRRLPLDIYLNWTGGSNKRLTLTGIVKILAELSRSGDWSNAFDAGIPRRFRNIEEPVRVGKSLIEQLSEGRQRQRRESLNKKQSKYEQLRRKGISRADIN